MPDLKSESVITKDDPVLGEILKTENEMSKRAMDLLRARYGKEKELWITEKNKTETELNNIRNELLVAENRLKKIQDEYSDEQIEDAENLKISIEELKLHKEREREKWDSIEQRVKFYKQVLEETQGKLADERSKYESLQKLHISEEQKLRDAINKRESEILQLRNQFTEHTSDWTKGKNRLEGELIQIKSVLQNKEEQFKSEIGETKKSLEKKDEALAAVSSALQETTVKLAENQNSLRQMQIEIDSRETKIIELEKKYNESITLVGDERKKWRETWENEMTSWQQYVGEARERERILKAETEERIAKITSIIDSLESQLAIERENLRLAAEKNVEFETKSANLNGQLENEKKIRARERHEFDAIIEIKEKEAELSKQQLIDQHEKITSIKEREMAKLRGEISQLNANFAEEQRLFQLERFEKQNIAAKIEQLEDDKRNFTKQIEQERSSLKKMLLDEQINFEGRLAEQSGMMEIIKKQRDEQIKRLQDETVLLNEQFSELRNIYQAVKIENEQRRSRISELEIEVQKLIENSEKQRKESNDMLANEQKNWENDRKELLSRNEIIVRSKEEEIKRLETAIDELSAKILSIEGDIQKKDSEIDNLFQKINLIEKEKAQSETSFEEKEKNYKQIESEFEQLRQNFNKELQSRNAAEKQIMELQEKNNKLFDENRALQQNISKITMEHNNKIKEQRDSFILEIEKSDIEKGNEIKKLHENVFGLNERLFETKKITEIKAMELQKSMEEAATLENEKNRIIESIKTLKTENERIESENIALKDIVLNLEKKRIGAEDRISSVVQEKNHLNNKIEHLENSIKNLTKQLNADAETKIHAENEIMQLKQETTLQELQISGFKLREANERESWQNRLNDILNHEKLITEEHDKEAALLNEAQLTLKSRENEIVSLTQKLNNFERLLSESSGEAGKESARWQERLESERVHWKEGSEKQHKKIIELESLLQQTTLANEREKKEYHVKFEDLNNKLMVLPDMEKERERIIQDWNSERRNWQNRLKEMIAREKLLQDERDKGTAKLNSALDSMRTRLTEEQLIAKSRENEIVSLTQKLNNFERLLSESSGEAGKESARWQERLESERVHWKEESEKQHKKIIELESLLQQTTLANEREKKEFKIKFEDMQNRLISLPDAEKERERIIQDWNGERQNWQSIIQKEQKIAESRMKQSGQETLLLRNKLSKITEEYEQKYSNWLSEKTYLNEQIDDLRIKVVETIPEFEEKCLRQEKAIDEIKKSKEKTEKDYENKIIKLNININELKTHLDTAANIQKEMDEKIKKYEKKLSDR